MNIGNWISGQNGRIRIGGTSAPNNAAVLDLNAAGGSGSSNFWGVVLPRVTLTSLSQSINGTTPDKGTTVYNKDGGSLAEGMYVWDGGQWNAVPGSSRYILSNLTVNRVD